MNREEVEQKLIAMFEKVEDDDYSAIEEYVENDPDECEEDIYEVAFRVAVREGYHEYVQQHTDDVDLNDGEGYSTYLYDAYDEEMEQILIDSGAFRSWDDYDGYSLAIETVNNTVLSFTAAFQEEVYNKFLEVAQLDEETIADFLNGDLEEEPELPEPVNEYELQEICEMLRVKVQEDGTVELEEYDYGDDDGGLSEFIEALGWEFEFEGDSWKFETIGVNFIK